MEKLVIATPLYNSQAWGNYIRSLGSAIRLLERIRAAKGPKIFEFEVWHPEGDSYVDNARNMIAKEFLKGDGTHLLFWDSDVSVDMPGFARILKAPGEIVGAAFRVKNAASRWSVILDKDENGLLKRDPVTGLYVARRIATGFMKIHRSVFEKLQKHDPGNIYIDPFSGENVSGFFNFLPVGNYLLREDYGFCERCKKAGIKIWCETRVRTDHFGFKHNFGGLHDLFDSLDPREEDPKSYSY